MVWNMFKVDIKITSRSGVFTTNFDHMSHFSLMFLLLILKV